jgi:hypothetical protein
MRQSDGFQISSLLTSNEPLSLLDKPTEHAQAHRGYARLRSDFNSVTLRAGISFTVLEAATPVQSPPSRST